MVTENSLVIFKENYSSNFITMYLLKFKFALYAWELHFVCALKSELLYGDMLAKDFSKSCNQILIYYHIWIIIIMHTSEY
jgi:hypothetical protein